jgi:hypothetical protein
MPMARFNLQQRFRRSSLAWALMLAEQAAAFGARRAVAALWGVR